jgi:hypothetical protein
VELSSHDNTQLGTNLRLRQLKCFKQNLHMMLSVGFVVALSTPPSVTPHLDNGKKPIGSDQNGRPLEQTGLHLRHRKYILIQLKNPSVFPLQLQALTWSVLSMICLVLYLEPSRFPQVDSHMDQISYLIYGFFLARKTHKKVFGDFVLCL